VSGGLFRFRGAAELTVVGHFSSIGETPFAEDNKVRFAPPKNIVSKIA